MGNAPDTAGQINNEGCSTDDKVQISKGENPVDPSISPITSIPSEIIYAF